MPGQAVQVSTSTGARFLSIMLIPFLEATLYLAMEGTYHEKGRNDPVNDNAEEYLPPDIPLRKDLMKTLVPHLAKDGVHHDEKTNRLDH